MRSYLRKLDLSLWLGLFLCGLLLASTAMPALSHALLFGDYQHRSITQVHGEPLAQGLNEPSVEIPDDHGRSLLEQGQHQLQLGQPALALEHWQAAEQHYWQLNNKSGVLRSQLLQTEALRTLAPS